MEKSNHLRSIRSIVQQIGFEGCSLYSINDLTDAQLYGLFELGRLLEPWSR